MKFETLETFCGDLKNAYEISSLSAPVRCGSDFALKDYIKGSDWRITNQIMSVAILTNKNAQNFSKKP